MRHYSRLYHFTAILVVVAFLVTALLGTAPFATTAKTTRVIVRGVSLDVAASAVQAHGGRVTAKLDIINAVAAEVPQANVDVLARANGVVQVTPDRIVKSISTNAVSAGTADSELLYRYAKVVGADQVWASGNLGQGVTVAVLDTGIDPTFQGLNSTPGYGNGRFLAYYDAFSDTTYESPHLNQSTRDPNGHGTHVAGTLASSDKKFGQYVGIAPAANLVAIRVLGNDGTGTYAQAIQGVNWAVRHKDQYNIRVLNVSMYGMPLTPYWIDPFDLAVMAAWKAGIVVVASAGNEGPNPGTIGVPGNTPYVITVGAFTDNYTPDAFGDDYIPPFSAAGPTFDGFVKPDMIAPGAHIASTMRNNSELAKTYPDNRVQGHYFKMSGTSMSAGVVSGIAALMLHQNPQLTPDQVKYRLTMTSWPKYDGETGVMAYSIWQQGAGRVWAPVAVNTTMQGTGNQGMDLNADLNGGVHYTGWTEYDPVTQQFKIRGDAAVTWSGGANWANSYYTWSGGFPTRSGGFPTWSGGFPTWAGGFPTWSGGFPTWSGGFPTWAGASVTWSGGIPTWSGGSVTWSGGFPTWSGGSVTWSGGVPTWSGGSVTWSGGSVTWSGGSVTWSGGSPTWSGGSVTWSGGSPTWSGGTPTWSGGTVTWSGGTPTWSGGTPTWSGASTWSGATTWSGGSTTWSGGLPNSGTQTSINSWINNDY